MKPTLSVIIVTKNEAHNIRDCLNSVAFADEIVVVDDCSIDDTVKIAKEFTDKIVVAPWAGCGPQKLRALAMATQEWVLSLDADERVSPELKNEIQQVLKVTKASGFEIPFQSFYLGKPIRFGDWFREKHLRLFKREVSTILPRLIHFQVQVQGKIERLKGRIYHYSFPNLTSVLQKINWYSSDGAEQKFNQGKTQGFLTAIIRGLWAFLRGYILRLGFLDGKEGFILAISNAEGVYYRYLKLMYLNKTMKKNLGQVKTS